MDFIQTSNKQVDKFGTGKHGFSAGNPGTGTLATMLSNTWCDGVQQEIINVIEGAGLTPSGAALNQLYLAIQAMIAGTVAQDYKASVRAATTANIASLAGGAPNTLDGVTLVANDRILVKDQTTGSQNGIYVVTTLGTGANGTWTRSTDADQAGELTAGAVVMVEEGTTLADSLWEVTTDGTITLGTTPLTFSRKDAAGIGGVIQGAFKNLQASATGLNANVTVSGDEIAVENGSNAYMTLRSFSQSINTATTGTSGIDAGTVAANTWYYTWAIAKADGTQSAIASLSSTAPTMPSGYTYKSRIGAFRTDSTGNKYPLSFKQLGRRTQYVVASGSNVTGMPQMASGIVGAPGTPTWVAIGVSSYVPTTASKIALSCAGTGSGTATSELVVAPNNNYGGSSSATNPPYVNTLNSWGTGRGSWAGDMVLESSNIYWASAGYATAAVFCIGWEDNL